MFYIIGVNPNIERADRGLMEQIWIEKYRPNNLSEVVGQEAVTTRLKNYVKESSMPHLLFAGPAGIGKTTSALALAREMFGELWKHNLHELNASDERGIKVVREKIKRYAQNSVNIIKDIPNFKVIILDEADSMTSESQYALRKIMEDYSHVTRFCIICNYYQKIIEPIISRCSIFRFKPINIKQNLNKLNNICIFQNLNYSNNNLNKIVNICRGDLRKSINFLQKCKKNEIIC